MAKGRDAEPVKGRTARPAGKARAAIAFGDASAAAPWMLLGIDPRQDLRG